ncbi:phage portal protein [Weissella tructae]
MDLQAAMKLFKSLDDNLAKKVEAYKVSKRYYLNQNDITITTDGESKADAEKNRSNDPLRKHDSHISSNHHRLLVDQKSSYAGATPPVIDVESKETNEKIMDILGDKYQTIIQRLIVGASLAGVSWLHVWRDDDESKKFRYGIVEPDQIVPIYSDSVEKKLIAVRRTYDKLDTETGEKFTHDEYWTETEAVFFKRKAGSSYSEMEADNIINSRDKTSGEIKKSGNVYTHNMGDIPFIRFANNADETGDLVQYKGQIDAYDLALNGFINDVQDVQQVIMVLTNYGGADLDQFMRELRDHKSIKIDDDGDGDRSGVDTLSIDIPVEARNALMAKLDDDIYTFGQGLNPNKLQLGTAVSGTALKMMHSPLEMKSSKMESEFRPALNRLIRFILRDLGKNDKLKITQTWTRSMIQNDLETAQVVAAVSSVTSVENIAKGNPLVDNWSEEVEKRQAENAGTDKFDPANDKE